MSIPDPKSTAARRVYAGENLNERTARRRQQFLDAGLEIFGTTGYRSATVRQLCKQAELTDRYFYESFATTEDLLLAVYHQQFDQLQQAVVTQMTNAEPDGDVMTTVRAGLDALFDMAANPCVARVCWMEVLGVSPRVDAAYMRTTEGFASLVVGFARQRFVHWKVDDDEARVLGLALIGAITEVVMHWLLGGYRESKQTLLSATARVFEGVMGSIEKSG